MAPVVACVTDRRRLGPDWENEIVALARASAAAGVHLMQIRERDLDARDLCRLVVRCVAATRSSRCRVIVNDRLDVALAAGAAGVHLPANGVPAERIRRVAPYGFVIGRSVHSIEEATTVATEGAVDYMIVGTVFPTASKPGVGGAGVGILRAVSRAVAVPVLAIGGITVERFSQVAEAGASGFAAIGAFVDARSDGDLGKLIERARVAFDTLQGIS